MSYTMKCPKCKKEMRNVTTGFGKKVGECCNNKTCWFYGITRLIQLCEDIRIKEDD